ncbi:MAG: peroxidase-related enzyme [Gammaproteobacteria bacterium]|nr:peroxidase-related enzyme [Gammaproteobacteria bacterium]
MTWIKIIPYEEATGRLKTTYDRIKGPDNHIDNILLAHGLRPHTLDGHMAIYKSVLHHSGNSLPKWVLETVGVYVSLLNNCRYCIEHHFQGLRKLLKDDDRAEAIREALEHENAIEDVFEKKEQAILRYAKAVTLHLDAIDESFISDLRDAGLEDGEILEVNQVAAYFAYANRTVIGLGVTTKGEVLGLSPSDSNNPDNWAHS